jgi:hypothetical protein
MIYQRRADIHRAFKSLEDAIEEKEAELRAKMAQGEYPAFISNFVSNSFQAMSTSVGKADDLYSGGRAVAQLAFTKAQKELDRNPWGFLGKVALCSLGLGLILGSRYRNSRSRARK